MTGPDEPLLRRYVRVDPTIQEVAEVEAADFVIANRTDPPAGRPALVINSPAPPPPWRRGAALQAVVLADAEASADEAVMRHVDLSGVAVRRVVPWTAEEPADCKRLVSLAGEAVILRTQAAGPDAGAKRIYIAFDVNLDNTNFAMTDAFVIFLANAARYLAPGGTAETIFDYQTPLQAGANADWSLLTRPTGPAGTHTDDPKDPGALCRPGIYADTDGQLHAVSLVGLRPGRTLLPPQQAVAALSLPVPQQTLGSVEFWPGLTVAAIGLWVLGWAARARPWRLAVVRPSAQEHSGRITP